MRNTINFKKIGGTLGILLLSTPLFSAERSTDVAEQSGMGAVSVALIVANIFLVLLVLYTLSLSSTVRNLFSNERKKSVSILPDANAYLNNDLLLDHDYDGIKELDNNLPTWWIGMFYISIIFGPLYFVYYHFDGGGQLQEEEYVTEMLVAEQKVAAYVAEKGNMVDETNAEVLTSSSSIANGKETYLTKCSACHGQAAEGLVGPNLTDKHWLYGGGIKDVFKSIKYGIPAKGMIAWKNQLTPFQIVELSSYILTLQGTNPSNAKAPQGDLYHDAFSNQSSADSIIVAGIDTTLIDTVVH